MTLPSTSSILLACFSPYYPGDMMQFSSRIQISTVLCSVSLQSHSPQPVCVSMTDMHSVHFLLRLKNHQTLSSLYRTVIACPGPGPGVAGSSAQGLTRLQARCQPGPGSHLELAVVNSVPCRWTMVDLCSWRLLASPGHLPASWQLPFSRLVGQCAGHACFRSAHPGRII